jgi:3-phenylpropionate/trans-cinnamate dioxygenase ferredoxin reductase subunit
VLKVPGADSPDVHYLRTMQDALRLRSKILKNRHVTVVGGGYIGLEVAATASSAGAKVTVLESAGRVLNRVTTDKMSRFFARVHEARGVEIRCNERVIGFDSEERLRAVRCESEPVPAEIAVVGVGAVPNVELAQSAGLACEDGVIVDEHCRTEDPAIYAAGDCTKHPNPIAKRRLRLESVQNATDQARVAALNMCGQPSVYAEVPWFWSQQYEYKLQAAGIFEDHDEIEERGSIHEGKFALLYRKNGALLGVDTVNMPREYMAARKAIADGAFVGLGVTSNIPAVANNSH